MGNHLTVDDELLKELLALAKPEHLTIGGRDYTTRPVFAVQEPAPTPLLVSTLTSLVDYINDNRDALDLSQIIVHADGPVCVKVLSRLSSQFRTREPYLKAEPMLPDYANMYNKQWPLDKFIPLLQSMFLDTEHKKLLLTVLANVRLENSADLTDTGITQKVTVRKGVHVETLELPSPLTLKPYCTFPDVDQPNRLFTFRLNDEGACTLIEADGGAWRQMAAISVKEYLRKHLPEAVAIIA